MTFSILGNTVRKIFTVGMLKYKNPMSLDWNDCSEFVRTVRYLSGTDVGNSTNYSRSQMSPLRK